MDQVYTNRTIFTVLVTVVITAAITNGIFYEVQNKQEKELTNTLQVQIDGLKAQLATARNPISVAAATPIPTTDPTGTWQKFTGNGITLKYPTDWTLNAADSNPCTDISLSSSKKYMFEGGESSPLIFQICPDKGSDTIDKYLAAGPSSWKPLLQSDTTVVGGKTAYIIRGIVAPGYVDDTIVFSNGFVYSFSNEARMLTGTASEIDSLTQVYNDILGTLTFTN